MKNLESIKFTVIIPTRKRADVLEWSLRSVTAQNYENLEIIVSDNYSNDSTKNVVSNFEDKRIRYLNTGKRVSMTENWEFALSHVSDGWVNIIGDDDALLPNALNQVAQLIESTGIRAIRSATCAYSWPSLINRNHGRLAIPLKAGYERRNASKWLTKVILGKASYVELPMLYNGGFIDFSVLEEVKKKTGSFYKSCVPDVYSACAISSVLEEYIYYFNPIVVNGISKHSNGRCHFSKDKKTNQSPSIKFTNESNIKFHESIPLNKDGSYPLSIQAILYESYLQSTILRSTNCTNHQEQLELILATSRSHSDSIREWSIAFASQHNLNIDTAKNNAKKKIPIKNIEKIFTDISYALNNFFYPHRNDKIENVYFASIAAHTIISQKPNYYYRAKELLYRLISKSHLIAD